MGISKQQVLPLSSIAFSSSMYKYRGFYAWCLTPQPLPSQPLSEALKQGMVWLVVHVLKVHVLKAWSPAHGTSER